MGEAIAGTLMCIAVVVVVAAGWILVVNHRQLEACARLHNVYACHMVAVPTPTEDETWEKVSDGLRDIFGAISEATQKEEGR